MEEISLLEPTSDIRPSSPRFSPSRIIGLFVFVSILCVIGLFSWRVFGFYRDIRNGTINPALGYTTTDFSRAATAFAVQAALQGDGTANLLGIDDPSLGPVDAKVTVVEFADFGCPYSKEVAPIVRALAKQYAHDVRFVFRDYPIDDLHPGATIAAEGGGCAAEQGKFWEYHDEVFASSRELSVIGITEVAESIGLDTEKFQRCVDSGYYSNTVLLDTRNGASAGVVGTPTFFFNGEKVEGSIPFTIFTQILDAMLQT